MLARSPALQGIVMACQDPYTVTRECDNEPLHARGPPLSALIPVALRMQLKRL